MILTKKVTKPLLNALITATEESGYEDCHSL